MYKEKFDQITKKYYMLLLFQQKIGINYGPDLDSIIFHICFRHKNVGRHNPFYEKNLQLTRVLLNSSEQCITQR